MHLSSLMYTDYIQAYFWPFTQVILLSTFRGSVQMAASALFWFKNFTITGDNTQIQLDLYPKVGEN